MFETKTLAVADWAVGDRDGMGTLEGLASPYGSTDSYGDTILPGAYDQTIADFLRDGWLGVDHDWSKRIGYPIAARSTPAGLVTSFGFHSDPEAQQHRTRTAERMGLGKSVGLSIGYTADKTSQRDDGVRVLERITLYEVSIVGVPAERLAQATSVKDAELKPYPSEHACRLASPDGFDRFRRANGDRSHEGKKYDVIYGHPTDGGAWREQAYRYPAGTWDADEARSHCASHSGSFEPASGKDAGDTFSAHGGRVLADLDAFLERCGSLADLRAKEGRVLSASNRQRLTALLEALAAAGTDIADLLAATDAPEKGLDLAVLHGDYQRTLARLNGVPV